MVTALAVTSGARDDSQGKESKKNNNSGDDHYNSGNDHDSHHNQSVALCHRDNGRPGAKTITVSCNAVSAHMRHGDTLGACALSASR
jgi:hypothetical protein